MKKKENKYSIVTFLLLIVLFTFSNHAYSQEDVIHIDNALVTVPITVLDREGRYIANLKKDNFQIFENGVEQEITFFEPIEQPFTVLLLLDTSGSMHNYFADLVVAANVFVGKLRPNDELIAVEYAHRIRKLFEATQVKNLQSSFKLKKWGYEGQTITFDAVEYALKKMKKIPGRKAIILFSDGEQYGEWASAKSNVRDAEESDALFYTIRFGTYPEIVPGRENDKDYIRRVREINTYIDSYMQHLSGNTGGRSYKIENIADLGQTFGKIANELGRQYSVGYYPKESGKQGERRQIKVKVNIPNAAVRSRDSYIVGANKN